MSSIALRTLNLAMDTGTPAGKFVYSIIAALKVVRPGLDNAFRQEANPWRKWPDGLYWSTEEVPFHAAMKISKTTRLSLSVSEPTLPEASIPAFTTPVGFAAPREGHHP